MVIKCFCDSFKLFFSVNCLLNDLSFCPFIQDLENNWVTLDMNIYRLELRNLNVLHVFLEVQHAFSDHRLLTVDYFFNFAGVVRVHDMNSNIGLFFI